MWILISLPLQLLSLSAFYQVSLLLKVLVDISFWTIHISLLQSHCLCSVFLTFSFVIANSGYLLSPFYRDLCFGHMHVARNISRPLVYCIIAVYPPILSEICGPSHILVFSRCILTLKTAGKLFRSFEFSFSLGLPPFSIRTILFVSFAPFQPQTLLPQCFLRSLTFHSFNAF